MRLLLGIGFDVAVEPDAQVSFAAGLHGRGDENVIAPDDGAGVAEAGNGRLPTDVLARLDVPSDRQIGIGDAGRTWPAELRPVHDVGGVCVRREERSGEDYGG